MSDAAVTASERLASPQEVRTSKLELVERLADDLAHEIKNPLHSVVINLEVLRRRATAEPRDPDDVMRYAGIVDGEIERVNRRLDLLLRVLRPGQGSESISLGDALREVAEVVELAGAKRRLPVRLETDAHAMRLHVPRGVVHHGLLNLAVFAIDRIEEMDGIVIRAVGDGTRVRVRLIAESAALPDLPPRRLAVTRALANELGGHFHGADGWTLDLPMSNG